MSETSRDAFAHFLPITVRWGEMDSLGHVNNVVYYRYAEDGRLDYILKLGAGDIDSEGEGPILADLRCHFIRQLCFPAQVEIATRVARIGRTSINVRQALFYRNGDTPIADYDSRLVWYDYARQTPITVPEAVRQRVRKIEPMALGE